MADENIEKPADKKTSGVDDSKLGAFSVLTISSGLSPHVGLITLVLALVVPVLAFQYQLASVNAGLNSQIAALNNLRDRVDGLVRTSKGDIGPQGIQGPQGIKGEPGLQGPSGPQGPKGESGVQLSLGPDGSQRRLGLPGELSRGEPGLQGPAGVQGTKGDQGPQGIQGPQGVPGPPGQAVVPIGAVVAFAAPCPVGWSPFEPATARFIVGAGRAADPKFKQWQKGLPNGQNVALELTEHDLLSTGGEQAHQISPDQVPALNMDLLEPDSPSKENDSFSMPCTKPTNCSQSISSKNMIKTLQQIGLNTDISNVADLNVMPPFLALNYCRKH